MSLPTSERQGQQSVPFLPAQSAADCIAVQCIGGSTHEIAQRAAQNIARVAYTSLPVVLAENACTGENLDDVQLGTMSLSVCENGEKFAVFHPADDVSVSRPDATGADDDGPKPLGPEVEIGDRVQYMFPENVPFEDITAENLDTGRFYTVEHVQRYSFKTLLSLAGVSGQFNSIYFAAAPKSEPAPDEPAKPKPVIATGRGGMLRLTDAIGPFYLRANAIVRISLCGNGSASVGIIGGEAFFVNESPDEIADAIERIEVGR